MDQRRAVAPPRLPRIWFASDAWPWWSALWWLVLDVCWYRWRAWVHAYQPSLRWYKAAKRVVRWVTGETELQRLCEDGSVPSKQLASAAVQPDPATADISAVPVSGWTVSAVELSLAHSRVLSEAYGRLCWHAAGEELELVGPKPTSTTLSNAVVSSSGSPRKTLGNSKTRQLDVDRAVAKVIELAVRLKEWPAQAVRPRARLAVCIQRIAAFHSLRGEVQALAATPYSLDLPEHRQLLDRLWRALQDSAPPMPFVNERWQELGFQGKDPTTDFRGMGILALQALEFFATQHTARARSLLVRSHDPQRWFPFAITLISIANMVRKVLHAADLRQALFASPPCTLELYFRLVSAATVHFGRVWSATSEDITRFPFVFQRFEDEFLRSLAHTDDLRHYLAWLDDRT